MKKIALFLALALVITSLGTPLALAENNHNPYRGIEMSKYDDILNKTELIKVGDTGYVSNVSGKAKIVFKGVDFGKKGAIGVDVYHGTNATYAKGNIEIRIDDPASQPIASVPMIAGSWSVAAVSFGELAKTITGVHDVYVSHSAGVSNLYRATFYEGSGGGIGATYSGDNQFIDVADHPNKYSIYTLYELGILKGITENVYDPNLGVSRAEYANVLFNIINDGTYVATNQIYDDVDADNKAYHAVSYLNSIGVISMPSDKKYNPRTYITTTDAIVMAVRALGFEEIAKVKGGYPAGYLAVAGEEGITDDLLMDKYLRRDTMAVLIENVLNSDYLDFNSFSEYDYGFERKAGILSKTRGILKGEGVVFANSYTSITIPVSSVKDDSVLIEGNTYKVGDTPAASLIGYEVNYFYTEKDGEKTLICVRPKKNIQINTYDTADGIEIVSLNENSLVFIKDGAEKDETVSFDTNTSFIYNNKAIDASLSHILIGGKFRGKITHIDNGTNGDTVLIDEYRSIVVDSIDIFKSTVTDRISGIEFDLNPKDGDIVLVKNGKSSAFSMITAGDVITIYSSKNSTGEKYVRAIIEDEIVSGTISETDGDTAYINGKKYFVSPQCNKALGAGISGDFLINSFGEIVTYNYGSVSNGTNIAVILQYIKTAAGTLNDVQEIKVYTKDDIIKIIPLAKNVIIDGVKCKTFDQTVNGVAPFVGLKNVNMNTLISYTLNSSGEVAILDTYKMGANNQNDRLTRLTASGAQSLVMRTALNTITSGLLSAYPYKVIPQFFVFGEENNEETLSYNSTYPGGVTLGQAITLDVYSFNAPIAEYVIWQGRGALTSGYNKPEFFERTTEVVTEEGESAIKVSTKTSTSSNQYILTSEDFSGSPAMGSKPGLKDKLETLKKGDAIRILTNSKGKVSDFEIIMFCDGVSARTNGIYTVTASISKDSSYYSHGNNDLGRFIYGEVISKTDDIIGIKYKVSGENPGEYTENIEYYLLPKNVAYCEYKSGNTVFKNVISSANVSTGDMVGVFIASNSVQQVVLYNH